MKTAIILSFALAFVFAAFYVWCVRWMAKREVSTGPRMDMTICDKHGPVPTSSLLALTGLTDEAPVMTCPICYDHAMKVASQKLK
jgi:hypothetical protein